jgi:predicted Zn-dependent protease
VQTEVELVTAALVVPAGDVRKAGLVDVELDAHTLVLAVHLRCESGQFVAAERLARRALARWPGQATGRVALGRALVGLGRYDEAQAVLLDVAHAYPGYAAAYRWLAQAFLKAGDLTRGRAFLASALRLAPGSPELDRLIDPGSGDVLLPSLARAAEF